MSFDEIKLGMTVEISPAVIAKEKMLSFARDYDNIPLHTDEEYAKKTPFGKLIAPGVMSFMSVWAKYLEVDLFGDELLVMGYPSDDATPLDLHYQKRSIDETVYYDKF